jgi:hypothetical protein
VTIPGKVWAPRCALGQGPDAESRTGALKRHTLFALREKVRPDAPHRSIVDQDGLSNKAPFCWINGRGVKYITARARARGKIASAPSTPSRPGQEQPSRGGSS